MSRLTGNDAKNLMEAYSAVYAPQELTEEQVWEEVEYWVNSLVEEGYDLSEYTWEEMYEAYIEEQQVNIPNVRQLSKQFRVFDFGPSAERLLGKPGQKPVPPAPAQYDPRNDPNAPGPHNQGQRPAPPRSKQGTIPVPGPTLARPAAPVPGRPVPAPSSGKPQQTTSATPPPGFALARQGVDLRQSSTTPSSSTPTPARPSLRSDIADLQAMRARSQVRQGLNPSTGNTSADIRARAARSSVNSSFDPFDVIKGHLLDEGYADTEESALAIMANMSEDWKQSIVEGEIVRTGTSVNAAGKKIPWRHTHDTATGRSTVTDEVFGTRTKPSGPSFGNERIINKL